MKSISAHSVQVGCFHGKYIGISQPVDISHFFFLGGGGGNPDIKEIVGVTGPRGEELENQDEKYIARGAQVGCFMRYI